MNNCFFLNGIFFGLQELHAGDKVVQRALDSYVVLATAESQGRMEVEHAFKVSEKLADGTLLGSSLADAKGPCDSESLGATLVLGDEISSQDRVTLTYFDILCQL